MSENQFDTQIICADTELKLSFSTAEYSQIVSELADDKLFLGKVGDVYSLRTSVAGERTKNTIFVGIGGAEDRGKLMRIEKSFGLAVLKAKEQKAKSIVAWLDDNLSEEETAKAIEAMHLAKYSFNTYKTDSEAERIQISVSSPHDMKEKSVEAILLAEQTLVARQLVNEPANVMTPAALADVAVKEGSEKGFAVSVLSKPEIEALGMKAFLAVARGSVNEPKLIVMRYNGGGDSEIIGLVGKGLCFDSGGYSIKPTDGMLTMKSDMGGAAAVIGAMGAIAKSGLKVNVVGVIAACENMISGGAYLPGDIISSMAGKTIEIGNTDAEGRLTLIDAITYTIRNEKASKIIDIATLTGAAIVSLGEEITAGVANDDDLWKTVTEGAVLATEKLWRLPKDADLLEKIKSKIADLNNSGGRAAGTITAAIFLEQFVEDKPWVHLDIAGPSYTDKPLPTCTFGATGSGVRMLYHAVKKLSK